MGIYSKIYIGSNHITALSDASTSVRKAYLGNTCIYGSSETTTKSINTTVNTSTTLQSTETRSSYYSYLNNYTSISGTIPQYSSTVNGAVVTNECIVTSSVIPVYKQSVSSTTWAVMNETHTTVTIEPFYTGWTPITFRNDDNGMTGYRSIALNTGQTPPYTTSSLLTTYHEGFSGNNCTIDVGYTFTWVTINTRLTTTLVGAGWQYDTTEYYGSSSMIAHQTTAFSRLMSDGLQAILNYSNPCYITSTIYFYSGVSATKITYSRTFTNTYVQGRRSGGVRNSTTSTSTTYLVD